MKILKSRLGLLLATGVWMISGAAQAALQDMGGGLLYDTVLNVTWLQDANYAATSGYCRDGGNCLSDFGLMTWAQANDWASQLVYLDAANGKSYTGWQLASTHPVNGAWNIDFSPNGTTDDGYNIVSPNAMLSYMYYVNLGLKGATTANGSSRLDYGVLGNGEIGGQHDIGLVKNLYSFAYWAGANLNPAGTSDALYFNTRYGFQSYDNPAAAYFAWAVMPGNIVADAVPEPETSAMLLTGLGLFMVTSRRRLGRWPLTGHA